MIHENQPIHLHSLRFLFSLFLGGVAGALTMLLFAPASGLEIRNGLRKKAVQLGEMGNAIVQVRSSANKIEIHRPGELTEIKRRRREIPAF